MYRPARRAHVRTKALVVFHIARRQFFGGGVVKLCKQVFRLLAHGIDQYIEAPPVRHADHDFLNTLAACGLDQFVHGGDKALSAFKREALLSHIFGMQKTL